MSLFRLLLISFCFSVTAQNTTKNFGEFATAIFIDVNGDRNYYACSGTGIDRISQLDFYISLGTFKRYSKDLRIAGGEIKSFVRTNANVCAGKMHYRVYKSSNTPKNNIFNAIDLPWESDCNWMGFFQNSPGPCKDGDQKWQSENRNLDLTSLCPGEYTLEIFFELIGSHSSTTKCNERERFYKDENGQSFKMNFSIYEDFYLKAFTLQKTINEGDDVALFCESKNQVDVVKYLWKNERFKSNEQNPVIKKIQANQSGIYTVWVNTKCGKWYKKEVEIQVIPKPKETSNFNKKPKPIQATPTKITETKPKDEFIRPVETALTEIKPVQNTVLDKQMVIIPEKEVIKSDIENKRDTRYSKLIKEFTFSNPNIKIFISDYDVEDGDILSAFYNNELIGSKIEVTKKGQQLELLLNENADTHELIFVAESFGKISPNTSEIQIIVDDKTIKYRVTTSKTMNAKFLFRKR